jgi:hypothetical protein
MPSPGVALPGPFVTSPSPVIPVATRWLRTSAEVAEFEQGVLYGCGPAQVGFGGQNYPPFIASPFLLEVNLAPSHCGSRALLGFRIARVQSGP